MISLDDIFTLGTDVLATELAPNGVITCQLGDVVNAGVDSAATNEVWAPYGYFARPSKPEVGKQACQAITINGGDRDICIAMRDLRLASAYGNLKEGEICIAAGGVDGYAQGRVLIKADGAIVQATTQNNSHDSAGMYTRLQPDTATTPGYWAVVTPWGMLRIDATGIHFIHGSGASMSLGGVANPTAPNYVKINATKVFIDSPRTLIGPTASNGGKGLFFAPVVAPVASPQTGVPVPIGAGMGVIMGETAGCVAFGV